MRFLRRFAALAVAITLIAISWLWWNRPQKVDMAAYVPADSLVYLEANSLPEIARGIVETEAWQALAPPAGIKSGFGQVGWLSRVIAWTGVGPTDAVVLSRAQLAVTVLGFEATEAGDILKIKPRAALVAETHTGEARTWSAVEKRVGDFALRAYGRPSVERTELDGIRFITWSSPSAERRIVAAVKGSVAVVGNDEAAVRACLAVRRGERPSLVGNGQVEEMRRRLNSLEARAFGYISPTGAARIFEIAAMAYAGQIATDPRAQSAAASLLPQLTSKILGSIGWSSRFAENGVEDRYFISLQNDLAIRLRDALALSAGTSLRASEMLPGETYSISNYNQRDPEAAWRGLNAVVSSQLDTFGAIFISRFFESALEPYGIEEPAGFMRVIGSEVVTARLDEAGVITVVIFEVRDEEALRKLVSKRLGANPRIERVGDSEMLISKNEERGAASFVAGRLLMGTAAAVRRCLEARAQGRTLSVAEPFRRAAHAASLNGPANVVTYTKDDTQARTFISSIASLPGVNDQPLNEDAMKHVLDGLIYAVSETRLVEGGFERKTRSSFGQFGTLVAQFSTEEQ